MKNAKKRKWLTLLLIFGIGFPNQVFAGNAKADFGDLTEGFFNDLKVAEMELEKAASDFKDGKRTGISEGYEKGYEQAIKDLKGNRPAAATGRGKINNPAKAGNSGKISNADRRRLAEEKRRQEERRKRKAKKARKAEFTLREKSFVEKVKKAKKRRKKNRTRTARTRNFAAGKSNTNNLRPTKIKPLTTADVRREYHVGIPLAKLTPKERNSLRRKLERLLTRKLILAALLALQKLEGGSSPTLPVGGLISNGIGRKSPGCVNRIKKLSLDGHPKEQGLPTPCFYFNRHVGLWSLAAGNFQITFTNWRELSRLFKFENFSEKNQAVAALELSRSSAARGSRIGEGFVGLVKGDLNSVCKASDPWAASDCSRHKGAKGSITQVTRQEYKKLSDKNYARKQIKRFNGGGENSAATLSD